MTSDSKLDFNLPIYEQAADWLIELREGEVDGATREKLDAWFRASPEHIRAYLELSAIWEDSADAGLDRAHSTDDLIRRAQGASNVIPLSGGLFEPAAQSAEPTSQPPETVPGSQTSSTGEPEPEAPAANSRDDAQDRRHGAYQSFWRRRPMWMAAAVSACVVGSASLYLYNERNRTITTDTGEQRFVSLVDGSTLELNSRSRVRIRFSDTERDVDLIEGQALFHVAHDAARPFIVQSGTTVVRAVGTQFDVYRKDSGTTVTVVEGRVAVLSPIFETEHEANQSGNATPPNASMRAPKSTNPRALLNSQNAIFLGAGEQITVSAQAKASPTHTDPAVATAWTQHELVFDSTSLIDVAQDFNRYNTRQLIVSDVALRDFHITGVFSSADPASLLKFLRAQRDLIVQESDDGIHVSKK